MSLIGVYCGCLWGFGMSETTPHFLSSDFMFPHLPPLSLSKQLHSLSFCGARRESRSQRFIPLHLFSLTTSCSPTFDLSHSDKEHVWIPHRRGDELKILDRYEREMGGGGSVCVCVCRGGVWREQRKGGWQNKSIPGEQEQLMNRRLLHFRAALLQERSGVNCKKRGQRRSWGFENKIYGYSL